jgi:hypothetical protein
VRGLGILAKVLGIGPIFFGGLILLGIVVFSFSPQMAPFMPYALILTPALVLSLLVARRAYPSAIPYLREGVSAPAFWHAAAPDLPYPLRLNTSARLIDGPRRQGEFTLLFEDRGRMKGYAVKVLKIADVRRNYETSTEDERMLLLDRMVKAIEGLGDVEAKLVIDRSPGGEVAHILLYSEVVEGDEDGAVNSVESAAKTLATSMEAIGMVMIDDASYMGYKPVAGGHLTTPPSRHHAIILAVTSATTILLSSLSVGLGAIGLTIAVSGILGVLTSLRLFSAIRRASCILCGLNHTHWTLGEGEVKLLEGGVILRRENGTLTASKYASITGNSNRELTEEDVERRLPMYLAVFNSLIYTLKDFRIALHIVPQPVGDTVKMAMNKADLYGMDAQVGGAVSGYLKAGKSINVADRITHGERPYLISGVVEIRSRTPKKVTWRELDTLDKQLQEARSLLDTMNLSTKVVKDGWGAALCHRFLYLPPARRTVLDPDPIPSVKALTRDFVAISPLAFRRRPLMPKTGIYLGSDEFGRPVYWNPEILHNPHMLVLGSPGTGKSTLVKTLIFRSDSLTPYTGTGRPPAFIIIDPAGEYAEKAGEFEEQGVKVTVIDLCRKKYNPLLLSGLPPEQRISRFVERILPNIIPLQPIQASIVYQGLKTLFRYYGILDEDPSTWSDDRASKCTLRQLYGYVVWSRVEAEKNIIGRGSSPAADPAIAIYLDLERRLRPFAEGAFALDRTDITLKDLLSYGGVVIVSYKTSGVEGSVVMGEEMQRLVTWSILEHIHSHMLSQKATEGIKLIVVIDEGHKFVLGRVEEVPLAQHLREERKFGTSYIIVSHLLDDLLQEADLAKKRGVPTIAALVSTTIVFGNGNPSEAYTVQRLLNLTDSERRRLEGFATGEAFIKWSIDPRPLYFKIEPEKKALVKQRIGRREMYYEAL